MLLSLTNLCFTKPGSVDSFWNLEIWLFFPKNFTKKPYLWRSSWERSTAEPVRGASQTPATSSSGGEISERESLNDVHLFLAKSLCERARVIIAFPLRLLSFASVEMRNGRIYSILNLISLKGWNLILVVGSALLLNTVDIIITVIKLIVVGLLLKCILLIRLHNLSCLSAHFKTY